MTDAIQIDVTPMYGPSPIAGLYDSWWFSQEFHKYAAELRERYSRELPEDLQVESK